MIKVAILVQTQPLTVILLAIINVLAVQQDLQIVILVKEIDRELIVNVQLTILMMA